MQGLVQTIQTPHSDKLLFNIGDKFVCRICGKTEDVPDSADMRKAIEDLRQHNINLGLPTVCEQCHEQLNTERQIKLSDGFIKTVPPISVDALIQKHSGIKPRRPPLIIPGEFQDTDRELLPDKVAHDLVMKWKLDRVGLILRGESGTGKTRTVWSLFARLWSEGVDVQYIDAAKFMNEAADRFRVGWGTHWIEKLIRCQVLIIDDWGNESKGERGEGSLFLVVKSRLEKTRPVIIVTQKLTGKDIISGAINEERMMALVRRIREKCKDVTFKKSAVSVSSATQ